MEGRENCGSDGEPDAWKSLWPLFLSLFLEKKYYQSRWWSEHAGKRCIWLLEHRKIHFRRPFCAHTRVKGAPWWRWEVFFVPLFFPNTDFCFWLPPFLQWYPCACMCMVADNLLFPAGLLVYVAMLVGALVWGGLCDKMGRRKCLIYILSIDLIFSFLSCFAQGYGFFVFFRFCSGFGWDTLLFLVPKCQNRMPVAPTFSFRSKSADKKTPCTLRRPYILRSPVHCRVLSIHQGVSVL